MANNKKSTIDKYSSVCNVVINIKNVETIHFITVTPDGNKKTVRRKVYGRVNKANNGGKRLTYKLQ